MGTESKQVDVVVMVGLLATFIVKLDIINDVRSYGGPHFGRQATFPVPLRNELKYLA